MSLIEIVAVAASIIGVWLTIRRSMFCWLFSLVSVLLYSWIFYEAKLYSDVLLQGIYIVLTLYGWWRWLRSSKETGALTVVRLPWKIGLREMLVGFSGGVMLGCLMHWYTDASLPWVDSLLTGLSLVGQLWMARRQIACWWLWIAVDAAYSIVFLLKGLYLTAALYGIFVVLATMGLRNWRAALIAEKKDKTNNVRRQQEVNSAMADKLRASASNLDQTGEIRAQGG